MVRQTNVRNCTKGSYVAGGVRFYLLLDKPEEMGDNLLTERRYRCLYDRLLSAWMRGNAVKEEKKRFYEKYENRC